MLLTRDGAAKLADLGLAAAVNQRLDLHRISVGHFACMAPEVLLGTECTYKVRDPPGCFFRIITRQLFLDAAQVYQSMLDCSLLTMKTK